MIVKNPSVDGMSLNNGYIIEEGDDNETRAICFACLGLGPLSICQIPNWQKCNSFLKTKWLKHYPSSLLSPKAVTSVAEDQDVNDNRLNFMPECKDAYFVGKKNIGCDHICKNVRIKKVGKYILFPLQC